MKRNWLLLDPSPADPTGGAPAPAPAAPAPAAPAPAPAGITDAQMKAAIEKARLEERTKLQAQITALTTDKETLATKVSELDGQLKALGAVKTDKGTVDVQALIAQVTDSARTAAANANAQLQKEVDALKAQNQQLHLERVRQQVIAEHGGEKAMVVALVTGNSEQEIRASAEEAKRVHAQIVADAKTSHGHGAPSAAPAPALPPSPPAPASATPAPQFQAVPGMTVKDWGKEREKTLSALQQQYS